MAACVSVRVSNMFLCRTNCLSFPFSFFMSVFFFSLLLSLTAWVWRCVCIFCLALQHLSLSPSYLHLKERKVFLHQLSACWLSQTMTFSMSEVTGIESLACALGIRMALLSFVFHPLKAIIYTIVMKSNPIFDCLHISAAAIQGTNILWLPLYILVLTGTVCFLPLRSHKIVLFAFTKCDNSHFLYLLSSAVAVAISTRTEILRMIT